MKLNKKHIQSFTSRVNISVHLPSYTQVTRCTHCIVNTHCTVKNHLLVDPCKRLRPLLGHVDEPLANRLTFKIDIWHM